MSKTTTTDTATNPAAEASRITRDILTSYRAALSEPKTTRTRSVTRVRLLAGSTAHAMRGDAAASGARVSVPVTTTQCGDKVGEVITVPCIVVLTALALGTSVQGSANIDTSRL